MRIATLCFSSIAVSAEVRPETGSKEGQSIEHLLRRQWVTETPVSEPKVYEAWHAVATAAGMPPD